MTNAHHSQKLLELVWTIPSIFRGLDQFDSEWSVYAPKCEPFWTAIAKKPELIKVYAACRGVTLASEGSKPAVVFVPNRQLYEAMEFARNITLHSPLVLVVEDHPSVAPQIFPREIAARAGLCVVEPCAASEVAYCAEATAKLSASTGRPSVLVTHHGLLGGCSTENQSAIQETALPRHTAESVSPIRLGRKFELNRQRSLPSPGEKISVGFVTIGMSDTALKYLVSELQLLGRVPMLNLRFVHPIDKVPVERLLSRCRHVVVLEPRPGEVERAIISIAQTMRREGGEVAAIWGSELPPLDPEHDPVKVPTDSLHPSVVARLTHHLLHDTKPSAQVVDCLVPPLPELNILSTRRTSFGTNAALELLRERATSRLKDTCEGRPIVVDGKRITEAEGEEIYVETWGEHNFLTDGADVIRDSNNTEETRILLIWKGSGLENVLGAITGAVSSSNDGSKSNVDEVSLDNVEELDKAIESSGQRSGLSIILVQDGTEPQFAMEKMNEDAANVDRIGFRPQHAIVIPIEQMAAVRLEPLNPWDPRAGVLAMPLESTVSTRWLKPQYRRWRVSLRPILERVEVTRTKPPVRVIAESEERLTPPKPLHANASSWRVHIAGCRGNQPGVVGNVLMEAGRQMGYEICSQCNSAFVGAGRRAWSQILFTRKQTNRSYRPLVATIPWGEADLLLGWDREEVLRSLDPKGSLQVGSSERTHILVNTDPLERQSSLKTSAGDLAFFDIETIGKSCKTETAVLRSFASLARYRFHNERLGDLIQLGMAFQLGLIPVTVDAINIAVEKVEKAGYARSEEAFTFGRRAALDPSTTWGSVKEEFKVDLQRLIKRSVRDFSKLGKRGKQKAEAVKRFVRITNQSLPGLLESSDGRQVMIDVVNGIRRCMLWGGEETANKFVKALCKLYGADRAETGRALTRKAVLPLAEAILIRDPIYLANLARSPEILRRIRDRLNVRHSRGDELKRRFLSRLRLRLWSWSLQADMRTSDWSSFLVSWIGMLFPTRWRGHRRDRAIRELLLHTVIQATNEPDNYDIWVKRFASLNALALSGGIHTTQVNEVKKILRS
jgi:hypothetical protein